MEGRSDWGRFDFGTFRRRDVLTMGRFDYSSSGRQPNFAMLNRGRHLYSAGWPSRWASLAHIIVFVITLANVI